MVAETPAQDELRDVFQGMLNTALIRGREGLNFAGLGPGTMAAIATVAREHPDADAAVINAAYDAFDREHCADHSGDAA
jgi:hypothetical protein